jgi:hypothetical protein
LRPPSLLEAESTPISLAASRRSNQGQPGYGPCVDRQSAESVAKAKLAMHGAPKRVSIRLDVGARAQVMSAERWRRLCGFCISP